MGSKFELSVAGAALAALAVSVGKPPASPPPASFATRPGFERSDAPHPVDSHGVRVHEWMTAEKGIWRCWFCDVVKRTPGPP